MSAIEDIVAYEMVDMTKPQSAPGTDKNSAPAASGGDQSFLIAFEAIDVTGKHFSGLKVQASNKGSAVIDNLDLLRDILLGRSEDVVK